MIAGASASGRRGGPGTPRRGGGRVAGRGHAPRIGVRDVQDCGRILYEAFATLATRHGFPSGLRVRRGGTANIRGLIDHPASMAWWPSATVA